MIKSIRFILLSREKNSRWRLRQTAHKSSILDHSLISSPDLRNAHSVALGTVHMPGHTTLNAVEEEGYSCKENIVTLCWFCRGTVLTTLLNIYNVPPRLRLNCFHWVWNTKVKSSRIWLKLLTNLVASFWRLLQCITSYPVHGWLQYSSIEPFCLC